ncbi:MAG: hypothetical protein M1607_02235 [Patescibacteria group bacterium]|nr:hypothetical protein [Patescibacteria group bacterium]
MKITSANPSNYKGVIIKESLQDTSLLKEVKILDTKIEPITPEHKTPWLKQWTLHTVEIPEEKAEEIAEKLSRSFDKAHPVWYADYKNNNYHFIIYAGKVFKIDLNNPVLYKDAKEYGISIGIPEYQVDFAPEDKVWER